MEITELKEDEIKQVAPLMLELYKRWDAMDPIDKIDESWFLSEKHHRYLNKLIDDPKCLFLVCKTDKIVGYAIALIEERMPFLQKVGYISETFVLEEMRGKSVGKSFVKEILKWFKTNKLAWYTVSTHSEDTQANGFWEHMGFKEFNKHFKMKRQN
ncbi:GNAT family N-acetyltransferase [Nanoarchaeota archaeon]